MHVGMRPGSSSSLSRPPIHGPGSGSPSKDSTGKKKERGEMSVFMIMIIVLCTIIVLGIVFSVTMVPAMHVSGPSVNSILYHAGVKKEGFDRPLRDKVREWVPDHHVHLVENLPAISEPSPDYSQEFWTPIDLEVSSEPIVTLCKLDWREYSEAPHKYSMFRDLVTASSCMGQNRKRSLLKDLINEIETSKGVSGRYVKPTGFVFHESRVGSTLVANLLGSDQWSLVFSESTPAANALLHCNDCSRSNHIKLIQDVFSIMGRSPFHKKLFFKFQSITSTKMDILLEAFPATPWAFVYRQPVQTIMSHMDPKKGSSGAPCLRSMRNPPEEVSDTLKQFGGRNPPKEAWCAAHLNMLTSHAIEAYHEYSLYPSGPVDTEKKNRQRGILINYESLPGIIPSLVLPKVFNVKVSKEWVLKMKSESENYSKGKSVTKKFEGDSEDKEERATASIQKYATSIMQKSYETMLALSEDSLRSVDPVLYAKLKQGNSEVSWKDLKAISSPEGGDGSDEAPSFTNNGKDILSDFSAVKTYLSKQIHAQSRNDVTVNPHKSYIQNEIRHSKNIDSIDYVPWAPFANSHKSKPFDRVSCPPFPALGYPKTYKLKDMLKNWNTDVTEIPKFHYDSLCHFDFMNETELQYAYNYREEDLPFVVYNYPILDDVVRKWQDLDYLHGKLGDKKYHTETSESNHFMYWRGSGGGSSLRSGKKWKPPTGSTSVTFEQWLEKAVKGHNVSLEDREHQYFRVSSDGGNDWLYDELPFFEKDKKTLMLVDPKEQRGIHCRFGMRSVIAEAHFDGSRNSIAMIGGLRRWILTHPNQCEYLYMLPYGHPSGRHSEIDWSQPDYDTYPNFAKVDSNEVILQPGDFLYVPTFWVHYIISLNINMQCNSRSGETNFYKKDVKKCGF